MTERLRPSPLAVGAARVLQVACGGMHSAALGANGAVWTWGVNDEGALGRRTAGELWEKADAAAAAAGAAGGAAPAPGDAYTPGRVALPAAAGRIVQLSAGDSHTAALTERGAVWAWGTFRDASGVMGFAPHSRIQLTPALVYAPATNAARVVRLASGADHVAAATAGGALLTWGSGQQGQLGRVGGRVSERAKLAIELTPTAVLLKRGRIAASTRVVDVACGTYATFARTAAGEVLACGLNNYGQLALEPGAAPLVLAPTRAPGLAAALAERGGAALLRPGQHHSLALAADGSLLSFGRPTYGRLGRPDVDVAADAAVPAPAPVASLEGVRVAGAAAGLAVSGAFSAEGDVWLWGFGTSNQLAKGDDDGDEVAPRKLAATKAFQNRRVVALEFGGQHAALLAVERPASAGGAAPAPAPVAAPGPAADTAPAPAAVP